MRASHQFFPLSERGILDSAGSVWLLREVLTLAAWDTFATARYFLFSILAFLAFFNPSVLEIRQPEARLTMAWGFPRKHWLLTAFGFLYSSSFFRQTIHATPTWTLEISPSFAACGSPSTLIPFFLGFSSARCFSRHWRFCSSATFRGEISRRTHDDLPAGLLL